MKVFFIILTMCFVLGSCSKEESTNLEPGQFKGKLVLKGICMNYVIQVVDGDLDASLYEKQWVHTLLGSARLNLLFDLILSSRLTTAATSTTFRCSNRRGCSTKDLLQNAAGREF